MPNYSHARTMNPPLPYDLLHLVLKHVNISEEENVIAGLNKRVSLNKRAVKLLLDRRRNPVHFFKPLVENPEAFLKLMRDWSLILGGIQAASFFLPRLQTANCPWIFFCDSEHEVIRDVLCALRATGFVFRPEIFMDTIYDQSPCNNWHSRGRWPHRNLRSQAASSTSVVPGV